MKNNPLAARDSHIWSLRLMSTILSIVCIWLISALISIPREIQVRIPPDHTKGLLLNQSHYPNSALYSNAFMIFTSIQYWSEDGETDYKKNIQDYRCYIGTDMKHWLEQDYSRKKADNEINQRTRVLSMASPYQDSYIREAGNGTWYVWLDVMVREYYIGELVKEIRMVYPLRISRDNRDCNPVDIAVDGLFDNPTRVDTEVE